MHYTVTWIFDAQDQVFKDERFSDMTVAINEAEKPLDAPLKIRVVVHDDDGNLCHQTVTGRGSH